MPEAAETEPQRPTALLLAYLWDALLAIAAILIALAPFSGGLQVGSRTIALSLPLQVLLAVDGALYAACVITVMISLPRHEAWVRRAQLGVLAIPIAVLSLSALLEQLVRHDLSLLQVLSSLLVALVDGLVLFAMSGGRAGAWYDRPGSMPTWVGAALGLFAVASIVVVVVQQVA